MRDCGFKCDAGSSFGGIRPGVADHGSLRQYCDFASECEEREFVRRSPPGPGAESVAPWAAFTGMGPGELRFHPSSRVSWRRQPPIITIDAGGYATRPGGTASTRLATGSIFTDALRVVAGQFTFGAEEP